MITYVLIIANGDYNNIIKRFKMNQTNDSLQLFLAVLYRIEQLYTTSIKMTFKNFWITDDTIHLMLPLTLSDNETNKLSWGN